MAASLQLKDYVKEVFEKEQERDDRFLTTEDLEAVLCPGVTTETVRQTIIGYPCYPIYSHIAAMLQSWMDNKRCPILDLPSYELLDEQEYVESRVAVIASIGPLLEGLQSLYTLWQKDEVLFRVREILVLLGKRGLLDLLGIRKTVGTKDLWPPSREQLINSFVAFHHPPSLLSVGARALAKHHHRDQSESWWGNCTGKEQQKNEHALSVVTRILDNATWINIHWLPQSIFVIEARVIEGYGARWTADGQQFRGFLEPQMVDGHEVGWKH